MSYLYSFIIGGGLVALINYFSRHGASSFAGILMTVPVITLVSIVMAPDNASYKIAAWGVVGAAGLMVFLVSYVLCGWKFGEELKYLNLLIAFVAWFAAILFIFGIYSRFKIK
ncbi:MAG: hypothetical protein A2W80_15815 [Candidatus Riflebacteria bacterium GWC2_50_8]|nr:MAG: hypothetical protein A2W80_15815 [Candidatus Riflebacteria bacterium GWC2_50_8]